jgi:hypothetical protein
MHRLYCFTVTGQLSCIYRGIVCKALLRAARSLATRDSTAPAENHLPRSPQTSWNQILLTTPVMEVQQARPILKRGMRRSRKFGRYDFERFERFDHRSSHASIGHATFDKVEVDCKFLFKKSQWHTRRAQESSRNYLP